MATTQIEYQETPDSISATNTRANLRAGWLSIISGHWRPTPEEMQKLRALTEIHFPNGLIQEESYVSVDLTRLLRDYRTRAVDAH